MQMTFRLLLRMMLCVASIAGARVGFAAITATGDVTPDPTTTTTDDELFVGNTILGELTIDGGDTVYSGKGYLGFAAGSEGIAIVDGTGSTWESTELSVGNDGTGNLSILNGGSVVSGNGSVGDGTTPSQALVDGTGSAWTASGSLVVQHFSTLTIDNGGSVDSGNAVLSGNTSVIGVSSTWNGNNLIVVSGPIDQGVLMVKDGGEVTFTTSRFAYGPNVRGSLSVNGSGSTFTSSQFLEIATGGFGNLEVTDGGSVQAGYIAIGGSFPVTGGIFGTGAIHIAGEGSTLDVTNFLDFKSSRSILKIASGGHAIFRNGFTLSGNTLELTFSSSEDHFLEVANAAGLSGNIVIALDPAYTPQLGDRLQVVTASSYGGTPSFDFSNAVLPSDRQWNTSEFLTNGTIYVEGVQAITADYNGDGTVNLADYTVWRNNLGATGGDPYSMGDGTGDGNVTTEDYDIWKSQFGMTTEASVVTALENVPEPSALANLLWVGASCLLGSMISKKFEIGGVPHLPRSEP